MGRPRTLENMTVPRAVAETPYWKSSKPRVRNFLVQQLRTRRRRNPEVWHKANRMVSGAILFALVLFVLAATGCCSRTISSLLQAHRLPHQHASPRTTKCTRCCPRNPVLIALVTCAVPSACATAMARTFRLQRTAVDGGVLHAVAPVDLAV